MSWWNKQKTENKANLVVIGLCCLGIIILILIGSTHP
jgi:hypothetical protein